MRIYTRSGDGGETGLIGGQRIAKNSLRIQAIGEVDELNACLGLCRAEGAPEELESLLERAQNLLFDLGAELAAPTLDAPLVQSLGDNHVTALEASMDAQTAQLAPLKNFILPGGSRLAANLHLARCVCRRAERAVLALHDHEPVRPEVRRYLNRLSDWLFVAARTANAVAGRPDVLWKRADD